MVPKGYSPEKNLLSHYANLPFIPKYYLYISTIMKLKWLIVFPMFFKIFVYVTIDSA